MNAKRLQERFFRYVKCDSESGNERSFCELIEIELKALGFAVSRDEVGERCGSNGWNVYGFLPGTGEPILFSAHLDTVTPGIGIEPIIENGAIRSMGETILGSDDKSGIAAVLEAVESVMEQGKHRRPVEVLFSVCEEIGLLGARHADYSQIKSKDAIVLDSGKKNSVVHKSPANMHLYFTVLGKGAHAAVSPEKGVHAIKAAAKAISLMPCGHVDEQTVMNVSNLLSPGKTNIVPDRATFDMEIRCFDEAMLNEHAARVERYVSEACAEFGASYELRKEVVFGLLNVPLESTLLKNLKDVYSEFGVSIAIEESYGGCDASWLCHNGITALNIGTGMTDVHSVDEHIAVDDLELTARVIERIISPE